METVRPSFPSLGEHSDNPLEIARSFEDAGLKYLHLVDLDGAKTGKVTNWKVIESVCRTGLRVDFGGGIKTENDIQRLFDAGVQQVNLGSIAVKNPGLVEGWIQTYGAGKIILSADVKNESVAIGGWMENSTITIVDFIMDYIKKGIHYITCTDISADGMLQGPNVLLYKKLSDTFPGIKLIASGGVSSMMDLEALGKTNVDGVIVGKAIYEGRIQLWEFRDW